MLTRAADSLPSGFYIVSATAAPGLQYVDSAALPKIGYVAGTPDLPISTLVSATLKTCHQTSTRVHKDGSRETSEEDRPCIEIELTAADGKLLDTITQGRVGSRLLLVIGGEPLFAPVIRSPISTSSFNLTLSAHADINATKAKIDAMVVKPKK